MDQSSRVIGCEIRNDIHNDPPPGLSRAGGADPCDPNVFTSSGEPCSFTSRDNMRESRKSDRGKQNAATPLPPVSILPEGGIFSR